MAVAGVALMCLGASTLMAQNNGGGNGGNGGGRRGNFDPAQMQQRRLDDLKDQMEITDDGEWNALQPVITKVMDAQRNVMGDRMRGMFGRRNQGGGGGDQGGGGGGGARRFFGTPGPEAEALQRAVDGKASKEDTKAALAKFVEARKAHEAALEAAQANLRKVLTVRQEAIATLNGLL
jgi:hypothetical protein